MCKHRIPFRYECELILGGAVFHPDFTIRHPRTGEIYYWEHLGGMDKTKYIHNSFARLETYAYHGIVPSINLITTYETKDHPLSMKNIKDRRGIFFIGKKISQVFSFGVGKEYNENK